MKYFFIALLFFSINCYTQISFEYIDLDVRNQIINDVIELENDEIIIANNYAYDVEDKSIQLIRLSQNGDYLNEISITNDSCSLVASNIFSSNNIIFVTGYSKNSTDNSNRIFVYQFDETLNMVSQDFYEYESMSDFLKLSFIFRNNIFFFSATTINYQLIIGQINLNNNIFDINQTSKFGIFNDLELINDEILVYGDGNIYHIDESLNVISIENIDDNINNIYLQGHIVNIEEVNLISGQSIIDNNRYLFVGQFDSNFQLMDFDTIGQFNITSGFKNYVAPANSISVNYDSTKFYFGGSLGILPQCFPFCVDSSHFILAKYNLENNERQWAKTYGGDAFYMMYGLKWMSDGGCLMYGFRYKTENEYLEAYALKVDDNGIITGETAIPMPSPEVKIFPNPFVENIRVEMDGYQGVNLAIYDVLGNEVYKVELKSAHIDVNLNNLVDGTYTYVLLRGAIPIKTGKLLKQ